MAKRERLEFGKMPLRGRLDIEEIEVYRLLGGLVFVVAMMGTERWLGLGGNFVQSTLYAGAAIGLLYYGGRTSREVLRMRGRVRTRQLPLDLEVK